jgi:methionine-rich copper-binding protein CopC
MKRTLTLAALALASSLAFAHAKLQTSSPANGATVSPAPTELRLTYNESVEVAMSTIKVVGPGEAGVAVDKVGADPSDDKTLVQKLPKLAPGDYPHECISSKKCPARS